MKYIVFQLKAEGRPTLHVPVIFPDILTHKDVAEAIEHVKVTPEGPFARWWMWPKAVSAGFVNGGVCCGNSESLKLSAHQDDTMIVSGCHFGAPAAVGFAEREERLSEQHYTKQADGHMMLCNANGTRSVFDDVDE